MRTKIKYHIITYHLNSQTKTNVKNKSISELEFIVKNYQNHELTRNLNNYKT